MSQIFILPNIEWRIHGLTAPSDISRPITFIGMKWKMTLVPFLNAFSSVVTLQLILKRLSPITDLQAKFKFSVSSYIVVSGYPYKINEKLETTSLSYPNWSLNITDVDSIKKSYPNFTLKSTITYYISISSYSVAWGSSNLQNLYGDQRIQIPLCMTSLSDDFSKLLTSDAHNDIVLKCGEKIFCAHKAILSARSEVFAAMFHSNMKETREGIVHITDMEPIILEQFLYYLYSGKLSNLSFSSVGKMYAAADKYAVDSLKIKCSLFVTEEYAEKEEGSLEVKKSQDTSNSENDANNQQKFSEIVELLKSLFRTMEWKALVQENPKLASEMCRPFFMKYT